MMCRMRRQDPVDAAAAGRHCSFEYLLGARRDELSRPARMPVDLDLESELRSLERSQVPWLPPAPHMPRGQLVRIALRARDLADLSERLRHARFDKFGREKSVLQRPRIRDEEINVHEQAGVARVEPGNLESPDENDGAVNAVRTRSSRGRAVSMAAAALRTATARREGIGSPCERR
jgi:hypothetical protein